MTRKFRRFVPRPVAGLPVVCTAAMLAGLLALPLVAVAQDEPAEADEAGDVSPYHQLTWRDRMDRPVLAFTRGPAGLVLTPEEITTFTEMSDRVDRLRFVERFWFDVSEGCPQGENPVRDAFWQRAEEAGERFGDAALPGWLTDRGRVLLLIGAPDEEIDVEVKLGGRTQTGRLWRYAEPGEGPSSVTFASTAFGWRLAAFDIEPEGGVVAVAPRNVPQLQQATTRLARVFRSRGCELTPEQLAAMKDRGWRSALWDAAGTLLDGGSFDADGSLAPSWAFFPAQDGATFSTVSLVLDAKPKSDERLVVMLRDEENRDAAYVIGTEEFPFEYRESGGKILARGARSLPPGRYKIAAGIVDPAGAVAIGHVGGQIVARVTDDSLRLTSVVLASRLEKQGDGAPGPFRVGGYGFTPVLDSAFRNGDTFYILFQVVGASANASGQADVSVSYALKGKHPQRGWVDIGPPQVEDSPGGVRVREVSIAPNYPPTDYKWLIEVKDKATGQSVSREVEFSVVRS